ncbi:MAG: hypothetical protein OSB00_17990 [Sphingomonas bacterium]|nr:hypothetical protein [Sphingomonas bacterium]
MPRRHDDYAHGITDREREVLDRSDVGVPATTIAREVGLDLGYVRQLIRMYAISDRTERLWRKSATASNRAYVDAIAATGRSFA